MNCSFWIRVKFMFLILAYFLFSDHDLINSNNKIIPPGVKIEMTIIRSSNDFYLLKSESDTDDYKVVIQNIFLYVPIGIMSTRMSTEILSKWQNEKMRYYYDSFQVKSFTIPHKQNQWTTDNIFPESGAPFRVFVLLVETEAFTGDQTKNPFSFRRKWTVEESSFNVAQANPIMTENYILRSENLEIKEAMQAIARYLQAQHESQEQERDAAPPRKRARKDAKTTPKNSQRTRTGANDPAEPVPSTSAAATDVSSFFRWGRPWGSKPVPPPPGSSTSSFEVLSEAGDQGERAEQPVQDPPVPPPMTKVDYYVTKLELDQMNAPLDQLYSEQTSDSAMADYVR